MWEQLLSEIRRGDFKSLARGISLLENQAPGSAESLKKLSFSKAPVIGFTGPPGAGKSTLVNALIGNLIHQDKKIAVLCIDPSSPFHSGAFLGDRIRMNQWTGNSNVYIRSLSSRGSLGGLHPRVFEIADLLKSGPFDYILLETVGVGQSEWDIVSVADITIMVLMPGAGDEIQALKSGILEVADLFVVNKSDYPGTGEFIKNLQSALHLGTKEIEILETIATEGKGTPELIHAIEKQLAKGHPKTTRNLAEKAYRLILEDKMKKIDKAVLLDKIKAVSRAEDFNLYAFVENYIADHN